MCSGHGCVTSEKRTCRGGEMLICTVRCGEPIRLSYSVGAVLSLHRIARLRAYCAVAFGDLLFGARFTRTAFVSSL
jgi:hypothetical protein